MKEPLRKSEAVIGIDVSKEKLDVFLLPTGEYMQAANSQSGFKQIIGWAKDHAVKIVVCEYTGGYERKMLIALAAAGMPIYAANPVHVRYYAKSRGILCKTDKVDAKILAEFAVERNPKPMRCKTDSENALKEFVTLRRQLVKERAELKNQLEHAAQRETIVITKELIELLTKRIKKIEKIMEETIAKNSDWSAKKAILQSVPGIGADTVRTLLADMPELGEGSAESKCSLAGVVPVSRESGTWRGKRTIFGGRETVRSALHNAAMAAIYFTKTDNVFKRMYVRLTQELHKAHNVAVMAVAHKMLKIAHTLLKTGTKWENKIGRNWT